MDEVVETSPFLLNSYKDGCHLPRNAHVEWHQNWRCELTSERVDKLLCLLIEIGDSDLCPERAERLGAPPRDGLVVGNADDEALFAFEQGGLGDWNHCVILSSRSRCVAS